MRRFSISCICLLTALVALIGAAAADADVELGSVVSPSGSDALPCFPETAYTQVTSVSGITYTVPTGAWKLTGWEVNTGGSAAGTAVTLLVLRPLGGDSYEVLDTDAETLPDPLPSGDVAAFTVGNPITVSGGEVLGLYASPSFGCFFASSAPDDQLLELGPSTAPAPGQTLPPGPAGLPAGYRMNLAATLQDHEDVGVTTSASPAGATVGALAVLGSTVTNGGPETGAATFTDTVPSGLTIESAVAGSGTCAIAGQTVTCTIDGLTAGESAPVTIVVTPTAAGSYVNTVAVAHDPSLTDPASANDSASVTLRVAPPPTSPRTPAQGLTSTPPQGSTSTIRPPATCVVPDLRRVPLPTAKRLLRQLGCKAGKVRHVHNRKVAKGTIVRTSPGPGTYAAGRRVGLVVSSGPARNRRHRHA